MIVIEERVCLTKEWNYSIHVGRDGVFAYVKPPKKLKVSEEAAKEIEQQIHDAVEGVIARYLKK